MKPLSQLLAEVEPKETTQKFNTHYSATIPIKHFVDRESYDKLKAIAVQVTRTLENIQSITRKQFEDNPMYWATMVNGSATESLNAAARKMLGDDK